MKKQLFLSILILSLFACDSQKKSGEVASYSYEEEVVEMSDELKKITPKWVEIDKICYGVVVQINEQKKPIKGKPIKAKVVQIGRNAITMKALETVSLVETIDCTKMGISKGETWEEDEGDLFLTEQEAINFLMEKKLYRVSGRVTVD